MCKITEKFSELQMCNTNNLEKSQILRQINNLKLSAHFAEFNHFKIQGYAFNFVLSLLVWMTMRENSAVNGSLSELYEDGICFKKDVYYRLKNAEKICWRRILWYIVGKFLRKTMSDIVENQDKEKSKCLILDDSLLEKTGKKIEKIGKVYDHCTQKMELGYKMLLALYFDGTHAIPLDFNLLRELGKREDKPFGLRKKDIRRQFSKKRMKDSEGTKRVKELDKSKIELGIEMFFRAIFNCISIDYVLCDSWFTCSDLIMAVRSQGVHLIGMYKMVKTKFEYRGKMLSYKEILYLAGKEKRCKKLKLWYKTARVIYNGEPVTLFFSKVGSNGDWKVILTTDTKLSFMKAIEIYQIRWSIEVFFKDCKQYLNLGKCQSSNFDAQIADTTITLIAYILLAERFRYDNYVSIGGLFRAARAENLRKTIDVRLWELFVELLKTICEALNMEIFELIEMTMRNPKTAAFVERHLQTDHKSAS